MKNGRKNPETVVVSGFSEPISFSVRIVGCGSQTRTDVLLRCPMCALPTKRHPYIGFVTDVYIKRFCISPLLGCPVTQSGRFIHLGCPASSLPINRLRQLPTPAHAYALLHLPLAAQSNAAATGSAPLAPSRNDIGVSYFLCHLEQAEQGGARRKIRNIFLSLRGSP